MIAFLLAGLNAIADMSPLKPTKRERELQQKIGELERRLFESEETLRAIHEGEVDALVVSGPKGDQVFSLFGTESVYRLIVETMKEAAFTLTFDGRILFCNAQFSQFIGESTSRIVGHSLGEFVAEADKEAASSLLIDARKEYVKRRIVFRARDGASLPAHISANVLNQPDGASICVVVSDLAELENSTQLIQQLRLQQGNLRLANARTTAVLEQMSDCFAAFDQEWRCIHVNPAAASAFHMTRDQLLGKSLWELWSPAHDSPIGVNFRSSMEEQNPLQFEYFYPEPLNRWFEFRCFPTEEGVAAFFNDITDRKRAEEVLRRSEEQFRALAVASSDAVYRMSPDWSEMRQLRGRDFIPDTDGPSNKWIEKYLHPDDRQQMLTAINDAIRTKSIFELEHRVIRVDGTLGWTSSRAVPLLNQSGEITEWLGTARDITERKRTEEEIHQYAEMLRLSFDAIIVWRLDGGIESWNRGAEELYGFSQKEALGHRTHDLLATVFPVPLPEIEATLKAVGNWEGELRHHIADSREVIVSSRLQLLRGTDGVARVLEVNRDITQRKAAEEAIGASEMRFRTMANAIPQLAWIAKPDGYIYWYNRRWYEYTGATPEQMEGWGWQSVHDPQALPAVMERWTGSIKTGQPFDMIFPLRGADGIFRPFLTRIMPLKDAQGCVQQWFGTNTDISEHKRIEEELRRLTGELEYRVEQRTAELVAMNRELEAFSYTVSHDLRAPLRHITSFIGLLNEEAGPSLDEQNRRYIQNVSEAAGRMNHLIDDLLMFSRIGRAALTVAPTNLNRLVNESREELAPETAGRLIDWHIADLPEVLGDSSLLRSVIVNLLSNAIKFTRHRDPARIEVGGSEQDGHVILFVRDNGVGFDMRFKDKLFGVFQRLHRQEDFEGTGIGLAGVRRIIHRHGGQVWAESEVDRGATFYFSIPTRRNDL